MEIANLLCCLAQCLRNLWINAGDRFIDRSIAYAKVLDLHAVELLRVGAQRRIALGAHCLDDLGRSGEGARIERAHALKLVFRKDLSRFQNDASHLVLLVSLTQRLCECCDTGVRAI